MVALEKKSEHLIIFTRYPTPGKTKTRLAKGLNKKTAAAVQKLLTEWTVSTTHSNQWRQHIFYDGADERAFKAWLGKQSFFFQHGENLGEKMARAFETCFSMAAKKVVILGIDSPSVTKETVESAFKALDDTDLVFGPSFDGGYYLLGMKSLQLKLIEGMSFGHDQVLDQTIIKAEIAKLSYQVLEEKTDVDTVADLPEFFKCCLGPQVDVVIPTWNEEKNIERLLASLRARGFNKLFVVDSGSTDKTVKLAKKSGATVERGQKNRGLQLNVGAKMGKSPYIWFLHADSRLDENIQLSLIRWCARKDKALLAFRFRVEAQGFLFSMQAFFVWLRNVLLHLPFGDQGFLVSRKAFDKVDGFPEDALMEDVAFISRLKRQNLPIHLARAYIYTSPRRWQEKGFWKATWLNLRLLTLYYLGVSPKKLYAKYYRSAK